MENLDQAPAVEASVQDRMEALLGGPEEGEPQEEPEVETPLEGEDVEASDSIEEESEPEPEEPQEEFEEINWNGEVKKIAKSELKDLAQKGFDYTQKTQQVAEQKKQVEAFYQQAQQSIALQNQQIETIAALKSIDSQLDQFKQVNWHQLAEDDPVQYLKLNQSYRDLKEAREAQIQTFQRRGAEIQQFQQVQTQQKLQEGMAELAKLPEFQGEKAQKTKDRLRSYLLEVGYDAKEVDSVIDPRMVNVALEAAKWRDLQKANPQMTKKVADVPKVVKPGTVKQKVDTKQQEMRSQLKKTGNKDFAAKLIERML